MEKYMQCCYWEKGSTLESQLILASNISYLKSGFLESNSIYTFFTNRKISIHFKIFQNFKIINKIIKHL